jgi:hypothetical protein
MFNRTYFSLFAFILLLNGCKKKQTAEVDNETQSVLDFSSASREYVSIIAGVHQALIYTIGAGTNQTRQAVAGCTRLTKISGDTLWGSTGHINPTYSISISEIDYCNNEQLIPKTKNNLGEIYITQYDLFQKMNAITVIKIKGRFMNTDGSLKQYNLCDSVILKTLSSDVNAASMDFTLVNGEIIQATSAKVSKLTLNIKLTSVISGVSIPYVSFYGVANGINVNSLPYTAIISPDSPIIKTRNCYFFKTGNAEITPFGFKNRNVSYGTDNCDDDANMKVNGNTIAFKLK